MPTDAVVAVTIAIGLLGVAIGWVALRQDRLRHEATKPTILTTLRKPVVTHKGYEPLRGNQLHLIADFRAAGGEVVIAETWLVAGDPRKSTKRHKGRTSQGHSGRGAAKDGYAVTREWPLVYTRELPGDKPWWVCWQDTSGRIRDPERVPDEYRAMLASGQTEAEAVG